MSRCRSATLRAYGRCGAVSGRPRPRSPRLPRWCGPGPPCGPRPGLLQVLPPPLGRGVVPNALVGDSELGRELLEGVVGPAALGSGRGDIAPKPIVPELDPVAALPYRFPGFPPFHSRSPYRSRGPLEMDSAGSLGSSAAASAEPAQCSCGAALVACRRCRARRRTGKTWTRGPALADRWAGADCGGGRREQDRGRWPSAPEHATQAGPWRGAKRRPGAGGRWCQARAGSSGRGRLREARDAGHASPGRHRRGPGGGSMPPWST